MTSVRGWTPSPDVRRDQLDGMPHDRRLYQSWKDPPMSESLISPVGRTVTEHSAELAARSEKFRAAGEEYARIRELRKTSPVAAHLRERRYELGMTQQEVATAGQPPFVGPPRVRVWVDVTAGKLA